MISRSPILAYGVVALLGFLIFFKALALAFPTRQDDTPTSAPPSPTTAEPPAPVTLVVSPTTPLLPAPPGPTVPAPPPPPPPGAPPSPPPPPGASLSYSL